MNRKTQILLPLIIAASVALGIFLGTSLNYQKKTITLFWRHSPGKEDQTPD